MNNQFYESRISISPKKVLQNKKLYWHFWVYCDVNLKLLPWKKTQKVNKQKICCKTSRFILVVQMSWTRISNIFFFQTPNFQISKNEKKRTLPESWKGISRKKSSRYAPWCNMYLINYPCVDVNSRKSTRMVIDNYFVYWVEPQVCDDNFVLLLGKVSILFNLNTLFKFLELSTSLFPFSFFFWFGLNRSWIYINNT